MESQPDIRADGGEFHAGHQRAAWLGESIAAHPESARMGSAELQYLAEPVGAWPARTAHRRAVESERRPDLALRRQPFDPEGEALAEDRSDDHAPQRYLHLDIECARRVRFR